jgi:hypothetical protein
MKPSGNPGCGIWLVGDSNPAKWECHLETALDPRHPTRHSIWTPVLDEIQNHVFLNAAQRIGSSNLYIRNAIDDAADKPEPTMSAWPSLDKNIRAFAKDYEEHRPKLILSFGAFSFEFCRRAITPPICLGPLRSIRHWGLKRLADEFHERAKVSLLVPLLHASIARGQYLKAHEAFAQVGGNYFETVGGALGVRILEQHSLDAIWQIPHTASLNG